MFVELLKDFLGHKAGARLQVSEADAKAMIAAGTAKAVEGDALQQVVAKAMEEALKGISGTMEKCVDTALKEFVKATAKSRKNGIPAIFGEHGEGDPNRTFGRFLLAVRSKDHKALEDMGSQFVEWGETEKKAALTTQTGTAGGYTVPTEFYNRLMMAVTENSYIRQMATIIPMSARSVQVPTIDPSTAPTAGDTAFLGGLVARWTEESADKNESEPNFKQAELTNYELSGYSKISNTLLADNAIGLEAFLYQLFAKAVGWYEDYAFLRGNGVGKPLGVVNWIGFIAATRSGASAFALADYAAILARWLPNYDPKTSCWQCHPTVLAKLFQMTSTSSGHTMFLPGGAKTQVGSVVGRPVFELAGLPLFVTEKLPALNTTGDVFVADWSQYLIGDRQQIEVAFSEHVAFLNNQTVWRFVSRVGGQPWLRDKITLADGSNSLSPFVGLS